MNVLKFIIYNWDFILLIIAAVASVVFAIFKGNKSVVTRMLYSLVTEAEQAYGAGTGSLKLAAVIDAIYPSLPAVIKIFITEKTLVRWIEESLAKAKESWAQNPALLDTHAEKREEGTKNATQSNENAKDE